MNKWVEPFRIDSFQLKIIAIITMLVDHIGVVLFPQYIILREIGRVSFPIFCFLLVEGIIHTGNARKYLERMSVFAVISEVPYDLATSGSAVNWKQQNVFFTLFLGLLVLILLELRKDRKLLQGILGIFWKYGIPTLIIGIMIIADAIHSDYGADGILVILVFYMFYQKSIWQTITTGIIYIFLIGYIQVYAIFAMIPIGLYNGKRGRKMKYFFYLFYPVHLLILWLIHQHL